MDVLLSINGLFLSFKGLAVLQNVRLSVRKGEIFAVIGPNGSGKTSLLNCINGFYKPERGTILLEGRDISGMRSHEIARLGIARTFQNVEPFKEMTVLENIKLGRHVHTTTGVVASCLYYGKASNEEADIGREIERELLDILEITHVRNKVVSTLPYGFRKRVELARALAMKPKLLLLDEPMAGTAPDEIEELGRVVLELNRGLGMTIVLVEHHMGVVMELSDTVCALEYGTVLAQGTPAEIQRHEEVIRAYLGRRFIA